jgi:hypothetical protein
MAGKVWTKEELRTLIDLYPNTKSCDLADILGRTVKSVYSQANVLGLKKSVEFLKSEASGRITNQSDLAKKARFKKGNTPWNKGRKGLQIGGIETRFKKGNLPHNTKGDGIISIREDEGRPYQYIRISKGKWKLLHNVIWEEKNGSIPPGYIVVFKDKNPLNCSIDNLELITRSENMERNTFHRFPPELKFAIKTLKKLQKTIKSHEE